MLTGLCIKLYNLRFKFCIFMKEKSVSDILWYIQIAVSPIDWWKFHLFKIGDEIQYVFGTKVELKKSKIITAIIRIELFIILVKLVNYITIYLIKVINHIKGCKLLNAIDTKLFKIYT